MNQNDKNNEPRTYYPTQDEINLLQDILDFINLVCDADARWCCGKPIDPYYMNLRQGLVMDAEFEKNGEYYLTRAWVDIKGDEIEVYVGPDKKETAVHQTFRNNHPFKFGEYEHEHAIE